MGDSTPFWRRRGRKNTANGLNRGRLLASRLWSGDFWVGFQDFDARCETIEWLHNSQLNPSTSFAHLDSETKVTGGFSGF